MKSQKQEMYSRKTMQQGRLRNETVVSRWISQQYQQVLYSCQQCCACPTLMDFAFVVSGGCRCCFMEGKLVSMYTVSLTLLDTSMICLYQVLEAFHVICWYALCPCAWNLPINCHFAASSSLHFELKGRAKGKTLIIQ